MSRSQQPADDGDKNSPDRFQGPGIPADVAADDRGCNLPARFIVHPIGTIIEMRHEQPPRPSRSSMARRATLLAIVACVVFAVWYVQTNDRTPQTRYRSDLTTVAVATLPAERIVEPKSKSKDPIEESVASVPVDRDSNNEDQPPNQNDEEPADRGDTKVVLVEPMKDAQPSSAPRTADTTSPKFRASTQRANSPAEAILILAYYFDWPKDNLLLAWQIESAPPFSDHKNNGWYGLSTVQKLNVLYRVSERTQQGSGDKFLKLLAERLRQIDRPIIRQAKSQEHLASIREAAIPFQSAGVSKAIRTCAFYLDLSTAIPATPEGIVGFHPAEYGIDARIWSSFATIQKLETMLRAAERSVPGSGGWVLATLSKAITQAHDNAALEPAFQDLRHLDVPTKPLKFARLEPLTPAKRLPVDELAKIEKLVEYLESETMFGGPCDVLQQFGYPPSLAAKLLVATRSLPNAIEFALSQQSLIDRQRWYLSATEHVSRHTDSVLREPNLRDEAKLIISQKAIRLGSQRGIGSPPQLGQSGITGSPIPGAQGHIGINPLIPNPQSFPHGMLLHPRPFVLPPVFPPAVVPLPVGLQPVLIR